MHTDEPDDRVVNLPHICVVIGCVGTRKLLYDVPVVIFAKYRGKRSILCSPYYLDNELSERRKKQIH